ncbi:MAG TPA: carboxypeptidase regulatory-like domain-containing protein [Bryobacteraceae bacterium]|nr:carboxypeptidase regulatory-like domain-containing protein [Bryobacteraceae bacterium]
MQKTSARPRDSFSRRLPYIAVFLALLLLAAASLFGQIVSGDLTGTVFDASGAAVPGASVTARNDATGIETNTKTGLIGEYRFPNLAVGTYTITVTAPGFTKAQLKGVEVQLNKVATANAKLDVGQSTSTVEVTAAAAAIDTTTAQVQTSFESRQLADLPNTSSGNGVLNLSLLNAGISTSGASGLGTGPSVGGQRPRNNNFTIEGIDNNSDSVTGPVVSLPNDAVAEFTVLQNQFSPDFGHSSGGQFNSIVRSGGNEIHGALYEYMENRNLNAADTLNAVDQNPLHPRYDDNRFGGQAGGPIRKNKLFYFFNYEYEPIGEAGSAGLLYAPTSAGWSTLTAIPGINQTNLQVLQKYLGTAASAASPASTPNGAYPLISPINQGYNGAATTGTSIPIGQVSFTAPAYTNNERAVTSIDYNISDKDSLRGRFILNRSGFIDTSASLPVFYQTVPSNGYIITLSEFHTFAPTVTNEFRLGYNRYFDNYPSGNYQFPGLDQFPNIDIFDLGAQLGPDPNAPQFGYQNTYELTDGLTWTKGSHTLKFGYDGTKLISPQSFTQRSRGDYEWSYLSDYLFDYTPDYLAERTLGNVIYYGDRITNSLYANDTWKVNRNLTANLGVRWEYQTLPYTERLQTINAVSSVPGLINFGEPQAQKKNFMPRVGLAYSPGESGRTSIRAGFGINYDVLYDNLGLLSLPPQDTVTVDEGGENGTNFLKNGGIPPNASAAALTPAEARADTGGYVPDQKRPRSLQWSLGVQHVFHNDYTIESRYMGTNGSNLTVQDRLNVQNVVNPSNALPVYFTAPSQATLNSLTSTLSNLNNIYSAGGYFLPAYLNAGFQSNIVGFMPYGRSSYNGWANQLTRRFAHGLQFVGSYTWSHNIDNSTADVFSTYTTPRRPQNFQNINADRSDSALDHRQRFTYQVLYDVPFLKQDQNWFLRNIVGSWEVAPVYQYQTGTWVTVQSGVDSNLNGDSAGDRTIVNPNGNPKIGSGTTALTNSAGNTVAYLVNNSAAGYIVAPKGTLADGGRNTLRVNPIDDVDMTVAKYIGLGKEDRYKLRFDARFFNILNHPQYVAGNISDVASIGFTGTAVHNALIPNQTLFGQWSQVFSSNPRNIQLSLKFTF